MSYLELTFPFFMFLAVAGVVRAWFKSKPGERPWLITIGIAGLLLLSLTPLAWLYSALVAVIDAETKEPIKSFKRSSPL